MVVFDKAGRRGISTKMSPSNNQQKNSLYFWIVLLKLGYNKPDMHRSFKAQQFHCHQIRAALIRLGRDSRCRSGFIHR